MRMGARVLSIDKNKVHYLNGGRSFWIDESTFNRGDVLFKYKDENLECFINVYECMNV
jgi:hypothetical protein